MGSDITAMSSIVTQTVPISISTATPTKPLTSNSFYNLGCQVGIKDIWAMGTPLFECF